MKKLLLVTLFALFLIPTAKAQLGRGELRLGYGFLPTTDVKHAPSTQEKWGSISLDYSFRVIGGLGVGATGVYSSDDVNNYYSLMPFVKMRWLNLKIVSFYSRAGLGWRYEQMKGHSDLNRSRMAWQVSPIGIEVGTKVAAYAEGGIGDLGYLVAGLRLRF